MERIRLFLPSVVIVASIAGILFLYLTWFRRRYREESNSIAWTSKHKWRLAFQVAIPSVAIFAPTLEELIFRAPIIIAFRSMTTYAWCGVVASSSLFAAMHWFGEKVDASELFEALKNKTLESDDAKKETERLQTKQGTKIRRRRIEHVVVAFLAGLVLGYAGIRSQSLWVSVGLHAAWNLLDPFVSILITLIFWLPPVAIKHLLDKREQRRHEKMLERKRLWLERRQLGNAKK